MAPSNQTFTPWLRRDQWAHFCRVYADPGELPVSYDEWLRDAQQGVIDFTRAGFEVQRVDVDLFELVSWCRQRCRRLDAQAMMLFAMERGAS